MSTPSGGTSRNPRSIEVSLSPREELFHSHGWSSRSPRPAKRDSRSATSPGSVGGSLDGAHRRRNSLAESQNAISTLLQPLSWTAQKPTSQDIAPVTLNTVIKVEPSAFKDYLSQVGALFDALQRTKLESGDGAKVFQDISPAKNEELAPCRRRKTSVLKRGQLAPAPLSTIPSVYFDGNFRLENPRTFDAVSEHADVARQPPSTIGDRDKDANGTSTDDIPQPARKTLTTNTVLQEKLSWYMDTVEVHLIFTLSQASASFFDALDSLRGLQAEAADSVAKIEKVRENLAHLGKEMVERGFEIISRKRRRNNLRALGEATEQLQCVLSGASHCEALVNSGQLETAIQHISYLEQLASGT
ncbi:hypothetical protein FQN49_001795, partial [Arthroderma sp. PD_2]